MTGKDRRTQIKKEGEVNIQSDIMFFIIKKKVMVSVRPPSLSIQNKYCRVQKQQKPHSGVKVSYNPQLDTI